MKIEVGTYRTRDHQDARVISIDGKPGKPIIGYVGIGDNIQEWRSNGACNLVFPSALDLVARVSEMEPEEAIKFIETITAKKIRVIDYNDTVEFEPEPVNLPPPKKR